ncbi:hypothetical protein V1477_017921 [Vespula maculifrons]|uniref:Uncharacterized protein n=1 Tax=Vespula maculifrons TaxID=7453 RepID=A0ABD2AZQ9_VESMC
MSKISVLTAIKGFMPASTMPLGSVTPWMVEQGPLYSQEKQGDMWGPHEEETGPLGGQVDMVKPFFWSRPAYDIRMTRLKFKYDFQNIGQNANNVIESFNIFSGFTSDSLNLQFIITG